MPHNIHATARYSLALAFFIVPSVCFANGWISGVNAFRRTPEFYAIFTAIVVVEWSILWLWLRPLGGLGALWRVLVLNTTSSLAGDVLFRLGWAPSSGDLGKQAIPFFLLTVAVELPLLHLLLRESSLSWRRTGLIVISSNVASYLLLIAIDRPVREAWLRGLYAEDQRIIRQWTNTQMLAKAQGRIYATESAQGGPPHRLRYFDFAEQRWYPITNSPAVHPAYWHVEGNLLAYLTYGEASSRNTVKVTTLPECTAIHELRLPPTPYNSSEGWDVAISPDRTKLAVLVPLHEIRGPFSGSSYRVPGRTCLVAVFDLATGQHSLCPRKALHTLCWLPDSQRLLFHSLPDEKVHELTTLPKGLQKQYDFRNPENPFRHPPLFAYRHATGQVEPFGHATSPRLAANASRLVFRSGTDALGLMDIGSNTLTTVTTGRTADYLGPEVSPDAHFAVVPLVLNPFVGYWGYPSIVNLNDPSQRYNLGRILYRVVWARTALE